MAKPAGLNNQPRDFVGYGPKPPYVIWPGGLKVAVNLVLNYEEGSEYSWDEDGRNDNWGEYNIPNSPPVRDLGTETHFEYGSRAGVWRLARLRPLQHSYNGLRLRHSAGKESRGGGLDECARPRSTRPRPALA